jgi:hypothetical protein
MRALLKLLRVPSPSLVLAFVALLVALGGTAVAATTIVSIADPTTPAHKAAVDATGALKTAGTSTVTGAVSQTAPKTPFYGHDYVGTGSTGSMIIGPTKSTVALTRLDLENHYDQTNNAAMNVVLWQVGGNATTCDGSSGQPQIADYTVPAGQTYSDAMASPIVLKPLASGDVWCLRASTSLQTNPGGYFTPSIAWSGYVVSGTLPPMTLKRATPGQAPRTTARP